MSALSEKQLEEIVQRAFRVFARREEIKVPVNADGSLTKGTKWNTAYLGFESGFLRRHTRGIDIGTLGVIKEEWLNYWIGFDYGQEERERCGFLYGL